MVFSFILLVLLSACGGGGGGGGDDIPSVVSSGGGGISGIGLSGGGADGPVVNGDIFVYDRYDDTCGYPTVTNQNSQYSLLLPSTGCETPWRLVLSAGDDLVTGEANYTTMYSLVMDTSVVPLNVNVSPLTTIIYYAALASTSSGNSIAEVESEGVMVDLIAQAVMRKFNFGMDAGDPDFSPLTTKIGSSNAQAFVKGNEGLIEAIRRTAWQNQGAVSGEAIDEVLQQLGEDMVDGVLNGFVRPGVASTGGEHLALLWELNAATVAMELMMNQLEITLEGGAALASSSGSALAVAASAVSGSTVSVSDIENVAVSALFVRQAKEAATVASALAGGVGEFTKFLQVLAAMENELAGSGAVAASFVQQSMAAAFMDPSQADAEAEAEALTLYGDVVSGAVSSSDESNALVAADFVMKTSAPVFNSSRPVFVEWSYPAGVIAKGGFKLYRQQGGASQLVCYINNPKARSSAGYESECAISAAPGDKVSLYLTAYNATWGTESPPSPVYENYLPFAEFSVDELFGECPLIVTFDASTSSAVYSAGLQFDWTFGDGTLDSGWAPDHFFNQTGSYPVFLTVTATDPTGVFSASTQALLDVACL